MGQLLLRRGWCETEKEERLAEVQAVGRVAVPGGCTQGGAQQGNSCGLQHTCLSSNMPLLLCVQFSTQHWSQEK